MEQVVTIPENIEYVAIEIIDKKDSPKNYKIITRLFKGLATIENNGIKQLFALTAESNDTTDIYNFKYYNIMTLIVLGKDTKTITYFTLNAEDQKIALKALETIVAKMCTENRMLENDPDIIDISTFKNIPDNIKKSQKIVSRTYSNNTIQNDVNTSYVKKYPEPSIIKRMATKKPTKKMLFDMITKITNIKKGILVPKLPKILENERTT
ncbi:MAG: hypothetical protein U9Q27_03420 [Patescibacteria group bacterium]|nr:hypothetical protein [Patescibacteria group bacterium]